MGLLDTLKNLFGGGTADATPQPTPDVQPQPEAPVEPTSDPNEGETTADDGTATM